MIIAWCLFIVSVFAVIIHILYISMHFKELEIKNKFKKVRNNMWIYFIIAICSAQYIWG